MNHFEIAFSNWVIKYRWWLIASTLIAVLLTASGMRFLAAANSGAEGELTWALLTV